MQSTNSTTTSNETLALTTHNKVMTLSTRPFYPSPGALLPPDVPPT